MKTVFTTGEAAKICKVSQQTIIRCFDSGQLKGFRVPGSRFRRIPRDQLYAFMRDNGIPTEQVNKVLEGRPHIVDAITNGDIQLVFNTTEGPQALADSRSLGWAALLHKVPYYTTLSGAVAAAQGIRAYLGGDLEVRTLQSYFSEN